jgi:hypothetical protein
MSDPPRTDPALDSPETTFDDALLLPGRDQVHTLAYELVGLQRVVNAIRLYGIAHERAHDQTAELLERISPMVEELGTVHLEVTDGALLFGETRVIEESDQGGIVDELFRDGIRVLSLARGIDVAEFLELLAILGTNFHLPQHQEDTLQGLLWAADLPHVSYEAVQGIEEAVEDSADAGRGERVDFDKVCHALVDPGAGRAYAGMPDKLTSEEKLDLFASLLPPGEEDHFPTVPDLPSWGGADPAGSTGEGKEADLISFGASLSSHVTEDHEDADEGVRELPDWLGELGGGQIQGVEGVGGQAVGREAAGQPAEPGEDQPASTDHVLAADGDMAADLLAPQGATAGAVWREGSALDTIDFVEGRQDQLDVPAEDLLQLWEEAEADSLATLLDRTISILIHTALFEEPGATMEEAAPLIEACMDEAAEMGLIGRYRSTIEMLEGIVDAEAGITSDDAALTLLNRLLRVDLMLRFTEKVDPEDSDAARSVERLIELGGPQTLDAIIARIPDFEDDAMRRFLIQRVVRALKGDPRPLVEDLRQMEPAAMRIRLEALARMDNYMAKDQLTALAEHAEAEVRIAAVELIPSAHLRHVVKRLAQRLAEDKDERVRATIIRRLEADHIPALGQLLSMMATAESFHTRTTEEKTLALATLARVGGEAAVRTLSQLMTAKASLVHPRQGETRRLAASALGHVSSPGARTALMRAAKSWDPGLRRAATEALESGKGGRS